MPGVKKYSPPRTVTTRESGPTKQGGWVGGGDGHLARGRAVVAAHHDVLVVAEAQAVAVVEPLRLHELELARDARLQAHEDDAAVLPVVLGALRQRVAVGDPAPDQAVAIDELALERQAVARVGAADVAAGGAAQAVLVVEVGERVVARGVGDDRGVGAVGGEVERACRRASARRAWPRAAPRRPGGGARRRRACGGRSPRPGAACGRRGRSRWRRAGRAPAPAGSRSPRRGSRG